EELYRVWGGVHQWTYDRPTMSVGERLVYQISCSTPCSEPRRRRGGRDLERGRRGYRAAALHLCRPRRRGQRRERIADEPSTAPRARRGQEREQRTGRGPAEGPGREDFLRNYQDSELNPLWLNRVSKLSAKGWKSLVARGGVPSVPEADARGLRF